MGELTKPRFTGISIHETPIFEISFLNKKNRKSYIVDLSNTTQQQREIIKKLQYGMD